MARIFIDGFESGGTDLLDTLSDMAISSVNPASGGYCIKGRGYIEKTIPANGEYYFKWRYREVSTSAPDGKILLAVYKGVTQLVRIVHRSDERIEVFRGDSVSLGIGTYNSLDTTWHLLEARIKISDTVGICQLKINGILDIDLTGIDTKPGADTTIDKVRLGAGEIHATGGAYIDDIVIDDASWIGDTKIQALAPTGVGNTTGWTPSVGANWECVDEKPASDVDYVSINVVNITDTYAAGNMAGTVGGVKCVQVQSRAKTEGSPTPTNLKLVVRSGGADYLSGNNAVPASPKSFPYLWENNPADSAAWEEADVNAMEIGVKSAA